MFIFIKFYFNNIFKPFSMIKLQKTLLCLILLSMANSMNAQTWLDLKEQGANYNQIRDAFYRENASKLKDFKKELKKEANGKAADAGKYEREMEGMVHFMRWSHFVEPRVSEFRGDMSAMNEGMYRAIEQKNREVATRAANWTLMGPKSTPSNGGNGRINAVRVHPTDPNTLFACTPASGLWKSTNGGASWTAISDAIAALGCTDVAFDPTNPNTMYLATGDGDAADVLTLGVYKSTDGGATWNPTSLVFSLSNGMTLSKILVSPTNANTIIVGGRAGVYHSTDAGATWTQTMTGGVRDLEFKSGDPSVIFAGGYGTNVGFWRSADGGATFTKIASVPSTGVQRVAVGVTPANSSYVYALVALDGASSTTAYGLKGVYQSTDGGLNFTLMSGTTNTLGWSTGGQGDKDGQGWYDLSIAVSPTTATTVTTGGVNIWQSTNGGAAWTKKTAWDAAHTATNYVHADIHDLTYSGATLYGTCDGGIFKSTDGGTTWTDISGNISNAQMYGLGLSASSATTIISGHQDNGTNLTTNGTTWSQINGGDGMLCFIDRTNNANQFSSIYNGSLYRSTNSGGSFSAIYTVPGGGWVTPWLQDPVTATTLYAAGSNVYKSTNSGTGWSAISSLTAPTGNYLEFVSIDVAKTNNQVIYASADARNSTTGAWSSSIVYKTTNGGTAWTALTGLPATAITSVHVDVNDANKVYVSLASYTGNSVYLTTNGGTSWTNISAGLPQIPANCFVTQTAAAGVVYCGTDLGVYYSNNSGATWESFTNGMPGIIVKDLEIYYPTNRIRAATFGRGIWDSNLNGVNSAPSVSITSPTTGSVFATPATITITATASDGDGSVANVEFYNGTTLLGSSATAPYSFTWSGVTVGSYTITAKAYDNLGATTTSTAVNVSVSVANDAGISAIATPNGTVGTASFTPSVTLKNYGSATLTSASILYKVDAGTETTYNWTGSLASAGTVSVTLPSVTGYTSGSHTFTARTSNPNASADGNAANDATTSNFTYSTCSNTNEPANSSSTTATVMTVNTTVSSQIGTSTDVDYYKFTTTTAAPKIKITLTNLPANYDIGLYKSKTNGTIGTLAAASQNTGTTSETIIYNTPTAGATYYIYILGISGAFSATQCYDLTLNTSSTNFIKPFEGISKNETGLTEQSALSIYPNPANDAATVLFTASETGDYTIRLTDITGKELVNRVESFNAGRNTVQLRTNDLPKGIFFVRVSNDNQSEVSKLVIER
jgi:photosystem II stability/assembly factor-like uncharacterized protein